jgi:DNA invertase Pin-like site-specific DNA recombinase
MHPKVATGRVAIYARYSSDLQSEHSIEDQARRGRDVVARAGGDPTKAVVFPDFAVSGASLERPGLDALMRAVEAGSVDVILTEDISRISRDVGDAANIFKRLQFAGVPLISISDGIDTSTKHAKLNFTVKSMLADMYLDDLRDKTLRGLEGRALAGFATGRVPYGYKTVTESDSTGRILGHKILIDENEAPVVVRIFEEYSDGGALHRIARNLNREGVPSPRAGSKHKRFGWGASTIRAILYNEKYAGTWRFKERQWIKVPGTNKRRPRARAAEDVMTIERPELRIIDAELWTAVRARLTAMHRKYTKASDGEKIASPRRCAYPLSGILVCDACGFPLTIYGGRQRYYRCSTHHTKGTCPNELRVREEVLRDVALGAIRKQIQGAEQVARVRKEIAQRLRDYSQTLDREVRERRERLKRSEDRIKGLVQFIADGERSEYIVSTLRDLEAQAKTERGAIERIQKEAEQPLRLPSPDEIVDAVFSFDAMLAGDAEVARSRLRRWLKDGVLRVARVCEGFEVRGGCFPLAVVAENQTLQNPKSEQRLRTLESNVSSGGRHLPAATTIPLQIAFSA